MIILTVLAEDINFAKNQIKKFEKTKNGSFRYNDVHAWRGVVCELLCSKWLSEHYKVTEKANCLEDLGRFDNYDMIINNKKVEIKSATKWHFQYILPKCRNVFERKKDIYVGCRYNERVDPNRVEIHGWMTQDQIINYPVKQNKGAKYFEVSLYDLNEFKK